jgi:hypothetical protein
MCRSPALDSNQQLGQVRAILGPLWSNLTTVASLRVREDDPDMPWSRRPPAVAKSLVLVLAFLSFSLTAPLSFAAPRSCAAAPSPAVSPGQVTSGHVVRLRGVTVLFCNDVNINGSPAPQPPPPTTVRVSLLRVGRTTSLASFGIPVRSDGHYSAMVRIPSSTPTGRYWLAVEGAQPAAVYVTHRSTQGPNSLPYTGVNTQSMVALGALIVIGTAQG